MAAASAASTGIGGGSNSALAKLDLSKSKTTPKMIASAILSLLPNDATKQNEEAKKLAKAFRLVLAQLDQRTTAMARGNESQGMHIFIIIWRPTNNYQIPLASLIFFRPIFIYISGTRLPIAFTFSNDENEGEVVINLPEDSFVNILSYCTGRGVVKAGEVSEAWLATSRSPTFWEKLDSSSGLTNESKKLNATGLVQLLGRPQLASLTNLTIPYKIKIGKTTMKQIAKACPHLEALDMGYTFNSGINPKDDDLIQAAESFPSLKSMRHDMWSITAYGVGQFARAIGKQLVDLRIVNHIEG